MTVTRQDGEAKRTPERRTRKLSKSTTSKTPDGRSATFRVQGSVFPFCFFHFLIFLIFSFFPFLILFSFLFFLAFLFIVLVFVFSMFLILLFFKVLYIRAGPR